MLGDVCLYYWELAANAVSVNFTCILPAFLLLFLAAAQHDLPSDLLGRAQLVAPPSCSFRLIDRQVAVTVLLREHYDPYLALDFKMDSALGDFLVH